MVAVTALSQGLSDAQDEVLKPLTGVGTDMTVTRPIVVDDGDSEQSQGGGPFAGLSEKEREQLQEENGGARVNLANQGEPGEKFSNDNFVSSQLSFSSSRSRRSQRWTALRAPRAGSRLARSMSRAPSPRTPRPGPDRDPPPERVAGRRTTST